MSEEGSGDSTGLELAVLAGMVLLAFPVYRAVVRSLDSGMGVTFRTAMIGYVAVVIACYVYYRGVGVLLRYMHMGTYADEE
ncbi:MAG: hypothetical protein QF415_07870 [Candidatus Undinarchaeales archaeon]|nr:hypothetical protein [Candidatus Undinarchaeales archaeon]MDP7493337.1 hypothetical protein [Candidatus Undinarchaeales archaeon]